MTYVGPPTWNHPAFHRMAADLRCAGHQVISPAELDDTSKPNWDKQPWDYYLRRDVKALADCEGIVLLTDWDKSKGAALELHVAKTLGMKVFYPEDHGYVTTPKYCSGAVDPRCKARCTLDLRDNKILDPDCFRS
jgi:hypothetical protein